MVTYYLAGVTSAELADVKVAERVIQYLSTLGDFEPIVCIYRGDPPWLPPRPPGVTALHVCITGAGVRQAVAEALEAVEGAITAAEAAGDDNYELIHAAFEAARGRGVLTPQLKRVLAYCQALSQRTTLRWMLS